MSGTIDRIWKLHDDGRRVRAGRVVLPEERLRTPAMLGLGAQHVLAMFGATVLGPAWSGKEDVAAAAAAMGKVTDAALAAEHQ